MHRLRGAMPVFMCILAACSGNDADAKDAGGRAAAAGAGAGGSDGLGCEFRVRETLAQETDVVVERFSYESDGLTIHGIACRPPAPGPHPLLVFNHGGVSGLSGGDRELCRNFARNAGYAVLMSEYRGEGGSDGAIELCLGEVDDVLRLLACAAELPHVDAARALMVGASHGGCITSRAAQRGARVRAAVDIFGPSDWAAEHAFWNAELMRGASGMHAEALNDLITLAETVTGGAPDEEPAGYAVRSPLSSAADLDDFGGDFLILHGTTDALVPASQSCALAAGAADFAAYYMNAGGAALAPPPAGCDQDALSWSSTALPSPVWPGTRYLVIYEGAGHDLDPAVPAQARLVESLLTFVVAKTGR